MEIMIEHTIIAWEELFELMEDNLIVIRKSILPMTWFNNLAAFELAPMIWNKGIICKLWF